VTLTVADGTRTTIVGPSGSGKTTLLRMIAGFEMPDRGQIMIDSEIMNDHNVAVPAHRRSVGIVAQHGALFPHLTVAGNIGFGIDRQAKDRDRRIAELLDAVELPRAMGTRKPRDLSGGEQQRVALARAIARKPRLMLLDEPFSALDAALREAMRTMVARVLSDSGITSVLVTHDQIEALTFADQVAMLHRGHLVQAGSPKALYFRPQSALVASFLGDVITLAAVIEGDRVASALGTIAVAAEGRTGNATIFLRPEQVRLTATSATDPDGIVMESSFAGPTSVAVVSLRRSAERLRVRISSRDVPAVGTPVNVLIIGEARVLP
jgi:iron(III) transport system ATP-binding protein